MESTVGYYAIKQCLIGFITERGESRCSVCAVTMPNCSVDKGLKESSWFLLLLLLLLNKKIMSGVLLRTNC